MHSRIALIVTAPWFGYARDQGETNDWNGWSISGIDGTVQLIAQSEDHAASVTVLALTLAGDLRWSVTLSPDVPWAIVRAAVTAALEEAGR